MPSIQRATGMQDVLPEDRRYWDMIIARATNLAHRYGFQRLNVPVLEYTELFARGVGAASDFFVQKEMYTIEEEDSASLSLRPEFTAGLVRAYIENGMASWPQPVKLVTIGPVFRRERPQAGRFRQHSQINVEILGETDPAADVEIMTFVRDLYAGVGFGDVTFQLNSTGCRHCKPAYVAALTAYLAGRQDRLAAVDQERMRRNPLRVLDSKEPGMAALLDSAPHIVDYLCDDCASHFAELRHLLDALGQPYSINFRLVRGLDYYTKTVFEVWDERLGAQSALNGGGRYDGLAEAIGGPPTPGVGSGIGIERVVLGLKNQGVVLPPVGLPAVLVAHFGDQTKTAAVKLVADLRAAGIAARLAFARQRRSLKSQMRVADKQGVRYVVIVGETELATGRVALRPMAGDTTQTLVPINDVVAHLAALEA